VGKFKKSEQSQHAEPVPVGDRTKESDGTIIAREGDQQWGGGRYLELKGESGGGFIMASKNILMGKCSPRAYSLKGKQGCRPDVSKVKEKGREGISY